MLFNFNTKALRTLRNTKKNLVKLIALSVLVLNLSSQAQTPDYYSTDNHLRYEDYEYMPNIKTVMLHHDLGDPNSTNDQLSDEVISMKTSDRLLLSFDDMDGGTKDFSYTFIHCDSHWQPSDINFFDVVKGYTEDRIRDYRSSYNTYQLFTHYSLSFPNESIRPIKSGNYIIKVYQDGDQDKLVLTRRFMIVDRKVTIKAEINQPTSIKERFRQQHIDFKVIYSNNMTYGLNDELNVVIRQNGRWDNALTDIKPTFQQDQVLDFYYQEGNVFNGSNEFRWFDTRTIKTRTERTERLIKDSTTNIYTADLYGDPNRAKQRYSSESDLNGKYFIHTQDGTDSDLECDYTYVHFSLPYDSPQTNGNFYIFGGLTDWRINNKSLLTYNFDEKAYECTLYLKQGYYNYEYVFLEDKAPVADDTYIEGSHYETENDYTIYVYEKPMGSRIDMLIGIMKFNSIKKF